MENINRRSILGLGAVGAALAASAVASPAAQAVGVTPMATIPGTSGPAIKGIGYNGPKRIMQLNPKWYYDWGTEPSTQATYPTTVDAAIEFIPMIWGQGSLDSGAIGKVLDNTPNTFQEVLGFNEPDHTSQSNMTPREAADRWPELHALNKRLGAPATVSPNSTWIDDFMNIANAEKLRVDFMTVHSYTGPDVNGFLNKLDSLYARWKRPIWVTEYAVADWDTEKTDPKSTRYTRQQVADFMTGTVAGMRARPWVERFAWKTRVASDPQMWFSSLFQDDGALTSTGQLYASL